MSPILALACLLLPQEELKLEDALARIEARVAPLESVSAVLSILEERQGRADAHTTGRVDWVRGASFRKHVYRWHSSVQFDLDDHWHGPGGSAFLQIHAATGRFLAFRTDKADPPADAAPLLEAVARPVDDGNLLEAVLYPRALRTLYPGLRAELRKDGDRSWLVLRVRLRVHSFHEMDTTTTWFYDAKSARLEKIVFETSWLRQTATVRSTRAVDGVELPETVSIERLEGGNPADEHSELSISFRAAKAEAGKPGWVDDPALPPLTVETLASARERLKKDPKNPALPLAVCTLAWREERPFDRRHPALRESTALLRDALDVRPDSRLLRAAAFATATALNDVLRCGEISANKAPAPEVVALLALARLKVINYVELAKFAAALPADGAWPELAADLRFCVAYGGTRDAKTLLYVPDWLKDLSPAARYSRLAILSLSARSGEAVEDRARLGVGLGVTGAPELMYLGAVILSQSGEAGDAAEYFGKLAARKDVAAVLLDPIQAFCRQSPEHAPAILEKLAVEVTGSDLMIPVALKHLEQGEKDKADAALKRALALRRAETARYRVNIHAGGSDGYDPTPHSEQFLPLIKKLVALQRPAAAVELLVAFAREDEMREWFQGEEGLMTALLSRDKEAAFDVLKRDGGFLRGDLVEKGKLLTVGDVVAIVLRRAKAGTAERRDVQVLVDLVGSDEQRVGLNLDGVAEGLEQGVKLFPRSSGFREGLADVRALQGDFAKAAEGYAWVLEEKSDDYGRGSWMRNLGGSAAYRFTPQSAAIVKIAWACLKLEDRPRAILAVEGFIQSTKDRFDRMKGVDAWLLLDLPDRAFETVKEGFTAMWKEYQAGLKEERNQWDPHFTHVPFQVGMLGRDVVQLALDLKRTEEAYVAAQLLMRMSKQPNEEGELVARPDLQEFRAKALKSFDEGEMIRKYAAGRFPLLRVEQAPEVQGLIAKLNDDRAATREEASKQLATLGPAVVPRLWEASQGGDAELKQRVRPLLLHFAREALIESFLK